MGKKSSPSAPPAPDPYATAAAQASVNKEAVRESALVNQINQQTPYGSLSYTGKIGEADPTTGAPLRVATTTLSPDQQRILDLENQAGISYGETANEQLGAVREKLAQPVDFSTLGAAPAANEETRRATADAIYARMNPQFDRDLAALETRLANQGIGIGSEAYGAAMDDFNRSRTDARLAVDAQAGGEMARMFGLESAARDRALNEMVMGRQIPLNELAAMITGAQVQSPQFVNTGNYNVSPADVMGAVYANYAGQQNAANMQNQSAMANTQGLYGLLGNAALGAAYKWSDARLKLGIRRVGTLRCGIGVYRFRYVWGGIERVGVIAQEVVRVMPRAVRRIGRFLAVDYAALN